MRAWRLERDAQDSYRRLATAADTALALETNLPWSPGLASCVSTAAIENLAIAEGTRMLRAATATEAEMLAEARMDSSPWVHAGGPAGDSWAEYDRRWRAVKATAHLRRVVADIGPPGNAGSAAILAWYASGGWRVDRAHRRFEEARQDLTWHGQLEQEFTSARIDYDTWLDRVVRTMTAAIVRDGVDTGNLIRQGDIFDTFVRDVDGPVAYVWVDAMRYELGATLGELLARVAPHVEVHAAVAAAPTITPVGMANLVPEASTRLSLALDGSALSVRVNGAVLRTPADRVDAIREVAGKGVLDIRLDDLAPQGEKELHKTIGNAPLIVVRSQEFDSTGESGMLSVAWAQFSNVKEVIRNVVARLGQVGVRRIVVTADHGFVALSRGLTSDRLVDPPSAGTGELHRRCWVGSAGVASDSTVRIPLAATGTPSDLDLIVPKGLAVFRAGGSKQFFHGGLSPQELIVPVVVVDTVPASAPAGVRVSVAIAGGRITTGAFAATVTFEGGDLFTSDLTVRVSAQGPSGGRVVGRVVSGDGFDAASGTVHLGRGVLPPVLTFQVTSNLDQGQVVVVEVLDARTGVRLGAAEAAVAANIVVEDDLE